MFNFTWWDIIKMVVLFPFLFIRSLIKSYNPINYVEDNKLIAKLYDLMEEAENFTQYMGKGPTYLESFNIKNAIGEHHIEYKYISDEFKEQNRIAFFIKRSENRFAFFTGGNSAGGCHYYDKDNFDIEKIAEEVYLNIERSSNIRKIGADEWSRNFNEWKAWREVPIKSIIDKYTCGTKDQKEMFYYLRRALIMSSHDVDSLRYVKAKNDLMDILYDESIILEFAKEIDGAYSAKIVMDQINGG